MEIAGPVADVDRVVAALEAELPDQSDPTLPPVRTPISFERVLPTPPELLGPGEDGWYAWRVQNWGTKWDADGAERVEVDLPLPGLRRVTYSFSTAWSPPMAIYDAIAQAHPGIALEAFFAESGNGFAGWLRFLDGRLVASAEAGDSDQAAALCEEAGFGEIADWFRSEPEEDGAAGPDEPLVDDVAF